MRQRALAGRARAPAALEGRARGLDGALDVLLGRARGLGDLLAGGRVEDGVGAALGGVDRLAVDEVLEGLRGGGHRGVLLVLRGLFGT